MKVNLLKPDTMSSIVSSKQHFLLCADYAELHNRITGRKDFEESTRLIKDRISRGRQVKIVIGLSRYNFFRLNEIIKFSLTLFRKKSIGGHEAILNNRFNIFPLRDIPSNFFIYLERLKGLLVKFNNIDIEIELLDKDLRAILETTGLGVYLYPEQEKTLARLLGIICEEAFIGPQIIVIDPYHSCNIKCIHCFVHSPSISHAREFLERRISIDKFKEIVDDAAELGVDKITLQGDGEPLMHPNFLDMIKYIRERGIQARFFTNGSLLNRKMAEEIINLEAEEIYCSLPAGSKESYEQICINPVKGNLFNVIVENMKNLMDTKRKLNKALPKLIMTHVIHALNYHELIRMAELDTYIGADAVRFYLIRLDKNNQYLKLNDEQIGAVRRDLPETERIFKKSGIDLMDNINFQLSHYEYTSGDWSKGFFLKQGCFIGWYFSLIPALGDISICCHLRTVGYLREKRFKEIWLSDYYREKRYQAKFISDYKDSEFLNGTRLYDEHCEHCDNHQNLLDILKNLQGLGLYKFLK